ncbi:hypothetical protein TWF718_003490 [Orbilia javanica]|uniref:Uncharacterized protein n=1 Tax=Orbilia javanica TaxID=47235 RepID=A0AAN8MEQ2_9PEZI
MLSTLSTTITTLEQEESQEQEQEQEQEEQSHIHGDITRPIHFYLPPLYNSPPRIITTPPSSPPSNNLKNFRTVPRPVSIKDMRNKEHGFHLGLHSFKPIRNLPRLPYPLDLRDQTVRTLVTQTTTEVVRQYLHIPLSSDLDLSAPMTANLITIVSTELLRARDSTTFLPSPRITNPPQIPQTPCSAIHLCRTYLPKSTSSQIALGKLSIRIITLYRPILPPKNTIKDHQLYISDSNSISEEDLIPIEHLPSTSSSSNPSSSSSADYNTMQQTTTYALKYAQGQKFWYWSDMDDTEGIIVQSYDSLFGCDSDGEERSVRAATGFFRLMPQGWDESSEAEWLVVRALVVG